MSPHPTRRLPRSQGASGRFCSFRHCSDHLWRGPPPLTAAPLASSGLWAQALSCRTKELRSERYRSPGTTQTRPPASRELRKESGSGKRTLASPPPSTPILMMGSENSAEEYTLGGEVFIARLTHCNTTGFLTYTVHKL